ncbi:MAG TPA: hypothetical protein VJY33_09830 [Isosphaeraceae bacterium]|nr:hypothetical protein [Isosphaeraceae bacterium]
MERQPDDFHLVWDRAPVRSLIKESKDEGIKARREPLLHLLDPVSRNKRQANLDGLKDVQAELSRLHEKPENR